MDRGKGSLGIRYLLLYLFTEKSDYLKVVKDCETEIKFWSAFELLVCNNDLMFENIPNYILDDAFNKKSEPVINMPNNIKGYNFGSGIISSWKDRYKEQFRLIRNALVHGSFEVKDDLITIYYDKPNYRAAFTINWFEKFVRITLSSDSYSLKKGMQEINVLSTKTNLPVTYEEFMQYIRNGNLVLVELVAEKSNQEKIADYFKVKIDDPEKISFQTLQTVFFNQLAKMSGNYPSSVEYFYQYLVKDLQSLVTSFANIFSVNIYRPSLNEAYYQDPDFQALAPKEKFQLMADKLVTNSVKINTINYYHLMHFLDLLNQGHELDPGALFYLKSAKELLIKAYASSIFIGKNIKDGYRNKKMLLNQFKDKIDYHYLHAKRVYLELLKIFKKTNHSLIDNHGSTYYKNKMLAYYKTYLDYMDAYLNKDEDYYIFRFIRNAIVHDNIEFEDGIIRLFDYETPIEIPTFKKKENKWTTKTISESSVVYEVIMSEKDFVDFLTLLGEDTGLELSVNISKYVKRKNYLKNK